jgi:hypothetical protein
VVTDKNLPRAEEYSEASIAMGLTSVKAYLLDEDPGRL